jgi:membrane-bound lytic murein transglycosylase B
VTAILGVETDYGGHRGDYPAIDADRCRRAAADDPSADKKVTLIRLPGAKSEYSLGFHSFYAIRRYNHSNWYAMAGFN